MSPFIQFPATPTTRLGLVASVQESENSTTHDLLQVRDPAELLAQTAVPPWVSAALAGAPFVVVRRGRRHGGLIPVGVRGNCRALRFAMLLPEGGIVDRISPERLASMRGWKASRRARAVPAIQLLPRVELAMAAFGRLWGPGGSVGFELATGVTAATIQSDLDLIIRAPTPIPATAAAELLAAMPVTPVRIDVLVETPYGGVALSELATGVPQVLLRTDAGPRLVANPWAPPAREASEP